MGLVKMSKSNIEALCDYLHKNRAELYPIENELLNSETDFIVNGYMKMLAVILQQPNEIHEGQIAIYKRLLASVNTDKSVEDYLRMALEITVEEFLNFSAEMKDLSAKYRFVLDALVLISINPKNDEQVRLVAEFAEALTVTKDELRYISTMARAIVCMDMSKYVDACELEFDGIPQEVFYGYMKLLAKKCVLQNDRMTIFQPSCEEDVTVEKLSEIEGAETPVIKLSNVSLNLSEYPLQIKDKEKVILDNCTFIGGEKHSILISHCKEVLIQNCEFIDFSTRVLRIEFVDKKRIINSNFQSCYMIYRSGSDDWAQLGGVIYSYGNSEPLYIEGCSFTDCGGRNSENYYRSSFLSNAISNVNNSSFSNCWHFRKTNEVDPDDPKRTMFAPGSKATNCKYDNSANFC